MGRQQPAPAEPVTGTAAGVPFTALPPAAAGAGPAPLVLTWHMMDAPCTDAAFAAALPMTGVPAWRVHLGMPLCGARMLAGGMDAVLDLARADPMMSYLDPVVGQAAAEFPAALAELGERLPVRAGPVGLVGGSLGGAVVLRLLAGPQPAVAADAVELVGALRARYAQPDHVRLVTVPGLDHPLAERPGLEPAPQLPVAGEVDAAITGWFDEHLAAG